MKKVRVYKRNDRPGWYCQWREGRRTPNIEHRTSNVELKQKKEKEKEMAERKRKTVDGGQLTVDSGRARWFEMLCRMGICGYNRFLFADVAQW